MLDTSQPSKRPFQPSITSFFGRRDPDAPYAAIYRSSAPLSSPPLPATVQSSLLNVGMRVRKSVPEGYKNKACDEVGLDFASDDAFGGRSTAVPEGEGISVHGGFAELTPYCGILKIGGHSTQDSTCNHSTHFIPSQSNYEDFSFGGSSQESSISTISSDSMPARHPAYISTTRKRRLTDDIEPGEQLTSEDVVNTLDFLHTCSINRSTTLSTHPRRPMAHPKTRVKGSAEPLQRLSKAMDQENAWSGEEAGAMDFEDADFLRPPDDLDREVEMGGF